MNKMKNISLYAFSIFVLVAVTGFVVSGFNGDANTVMENVTIETFNEASVDGGESLGAVAGPNVFYDMVFHGTVDIVGRTQEGGSVRAAISSTTNEVLTDSDICDYSYIPVLPIQSLNLTLPATSTIVACLTNPGQVIDLVIENTATTTNNVTIVAGAGMDLQEPDGQDVVIGQNNFGFLKLIKQSNGDVLVTVTETIPAD